MNGIGHHNIQIINIYELKLLTDWLIQHHVTCYRLNDLIKNMRGMLQNSFILLAYLTDSVAFDLASS